MSVDDAEFCHSMLGSAVPFSGDARPQAGASRQSVWADLKRSSLIACPHWAPGRITYRRGCTACEATDPSDSFKSEPSSLNPPAPDSRPLDQQTRDGSES